jgi:ribosomal protein S18 acetylase RimI-like enzyme
MKHGYSIREARPEEHAELGRLIVDAYANLPGMPSVAEQPEYYERLMDVAQRAANPSIRVFAAVGDAGELLGSVDFVEEMKEYRSGGTAGEVRDAAGIRLLAVRPDGRGKGVGKALTEYCMQRAASLGRAQVVLHTTRAMETAWKMYERLGFVRFPEIDFQQGRLDVFGFKVVLS